MENDTLNRLFVEPFQSFYESLIEYLPKIFGFLLIFVAGIVLGKALKVVMLHAFRIIHLDTLSERVGIREVLGKGGIREPLSALLSRLVGWMTIFVFFIIALDVLEVPEAGSLLRQFFLYLPNIFAASVIIFLGYLLSNFLGRAALIACVNAEVKSSGLVGRTVKIAVIVLASTMALEQLGIGKETILLSFSILLGGAVFALALALGLGGKDIAREFIEKRISSSKKEKGDEEKDEIRHI